ncbi:MAG: hypothetical protein GW939_03930, partial [Candidatus Magasanikbacteria bacterium]|nr:hypothetical protein [Candidatus Magasanikbacteria bacterium]
MMFRRYSKRCILLLMMVIEVFAVSHFFPTEVFAQGVQGDVFGVAEFADQTALGSGDIRSVVAQIINVFLGLLGVIAVVLIVYAGYLYLTANGNEDQISRAKKILINAVIGLAIILSSFAIARFVIRSLS